MFKLIERMTASLRRRRVRRITVAELSALDDRLLKDVGIHRGEIRRVVDELLQATEGAQIRPGPDVEAQAATANVRILPAYDDDHRVAA